MVLSSILVFGLIVKDGDLLFGFIFSYLLGAGTFKGSKGMWPLEGIFYNKITYTSRLSYIENPFLDCLFLSKTVSSLYLEALGEQVKSLVKSDLFP